jgi:polyhydroxyalkanoate synthase
MTDTTGSSRHPTPRSGPRPLPLHLLSASTTWQSSRLALPLLKTGLLPWRADLSDRAAALEQDLANITLADLSEAVDAELKRRADRFVTGIERYRHHPYRRDLEDPPAIWQEGTTRLLDYGPADGMPVLVVPSLVNRGYILDLHRECSFLRTLSARGLRPLLVDWDRPGRVERGFDLTAYITGRLDLAFEAAASIAGSPLAVMGYCMGGLMALALAERRQRDVVGLVLIATPWDFHQGPEAPRRVIGMLGGSFEAAFGALGEVPTDMLQTLFFLGDPQLAIRKFARFAELDPESAAARRFVATEDWINDGVPLALPTARGCIESWYRENEPARGAWRVAGRTVEPGRFLKPALAVIATRDTLVPAATATPLPATLPQGIALTRDLGHIGLIVGSEAPNLVWRPIADRLLSWRQG